MGEGHVRLPNKVLHRVGPREAIFVLQLWRLRQYTQLLCEDMIHSNPHLARRDMDHELNRRQISAEWETVLDELE